MVETKEKRHVLKEMSDISKAEKTILNLASHITRQKVKVVNSRKFEVNLAESFMGVSYQHYNFLHCYERYSLSKQNV